MPRERIGMSPPEVLAFLREQRWTVLGTLDPDGGPFGDAVACTLEGETLYFAVPRGGRSHANLEHDRRACCAADSFPSYYEIKGVTVHGAARPVADPATSARIAAAIRALSPMGLAVGDAAALYALSLDDVFSFDFAKIGKRL